MSVFPVRPGSPGPAATTATTRYYNVTPEQVVVPSLGQISKNDLVFWSERGGVLPVLPVMGIEIANNTTIGPNVLAPLSSVFSDSQYDVDGYMMQRMCELGNGNIALAYSGNGQYESSCMNVRILDVIGRHVSDVTVSTDANIRSYRVVTLCDSCFLVVWCAGSSGLYFSIISNDGDTIVDRAFVGAMLSTDSMYWNVAKTKSGFAIVNQDSSSVLNIHHYTNTGVEIFSSVLETQSSKGVSVLGCANGDVVTAYYKTDTSSFISRRYKSDGIQVGQRLQLASGASFAYGDFSRCICELGDGTVAIAGASTNSTPAVYLLSVEQNKIASVPLECQEGEVPSLFSQQRGVVVFARRGNKTEMYKISDIGTIQKQSIINHSSASSGKTGSSSGVLSFSMGSKAVVVRVGKSTTGMDLLLFCVTDDTLLWGDEIVLRTESAGCDMYTVSALLHSSGVLFVAFRNGLQPYFCTAIYQVARGSVLGVAQNDTEAAASVIVNTSGSYLINQQLGAGGHFDNRDSDIVGPRGFVVGSSAILLGVQ